MQYTIYDSHAHIYPQKIAVKAASAVGSFYAAGMAGNGTIESLLDFGKEAGISKFVVHSVATVPHQVSSINRFIYESCQAHPEFIGFMTLHQDMTEQEIADEVDLCIKNGFKGVKLHPDFQHFAINSPEAEKMYNVVGDRLPILFHTGDKRYNYSSPYFLAEMAKKYPKMRFIGAHFGGYSCWDQVADAYKGCDNVWFDTSSTTGFFGDKEFLAGLVRKFGAERFFFGCDYPMWKASEEIERFLQIPLTEREREMIFSENLGAFLNI
ncbi:MAG: amidohydrolase family protein [Clostridia bacterium]|nr:amidohydrolase family protein [Clostridia bacterium]